MFIEQPVLLPSSMQSASQTPELEDRAWEQHVKRQTGVKAHRRPSVNTHFPLSSLLSPVTLGMCRQKNCNPIRLIYMKVGRGWGSSPV